MPPDPGASYPPTARKAVPAGRTRFRRWFGLLIGQSAFAAVQQLIVGAAGIIIVRGFTKPEYARYIIAFTLLSAVGLLADAGVLSTLMRQGGAVRESPAALASLLRQAVRFRRRTTVASLVVVTPVGTILLLRAGASIPFTAGAVIIVGFGCFQAAASGMNLAMLRLDYQFSRASGIQLQAAMLRAAGVLAMVVIGGPTGLLGLLVLVGLTSAFEARRSRPTLVSESAIGTEHDFSSDFRLNARRVIPNNLFFILQGQFLIGGLALVGDVTTLAEVSALSRFSLLFGLVGTVINNIVMPTLARQSELKRIVTVYFSGVLLYAGASMVLLVSMITFPDIYLRVLGADYADLRVDLLWVNVGGLVAGLGGTLGWLNQGRAWFRRAWLYVPTTLIWLAILVSFVGLDDLRHAAIFVALAPVPSVTANLYCAALGFRDEIANKHLVMLGKPSD